MKRNSPDLWDKVWNDSGLNRKDKLILAAEEATVRWSRLYQILLKELGTLQKKKVIEIGSGMGTYAALMASKGARATLLDYSSSALRRAKEFFNNNELSARLVKGDALNLPEEIKREKFDISISGGLTEHFIGKKRLRINKVHLDMLKKGGIAVIIVPNKYNPPYRIFKFIAELTGTWKYGEEYPYSRRELKSLVQELDAEYIALFGDNLYSSIKFLLPANCLRRIFGVGFPTSFLKIKRERGTIFDNYLSYGLVLVMRKK